MLEKYLPYILICLLGVSSVWNNTTINRNLDLLNKTSIEIINVLETNNLLE